MYLIIASYVSLNKNAAIAAVSVTIWATTQIKLIKSDDQFETAYDTHKTKKGVVDIGYLAITDASNFISDIQSCWEKQLLISTPHMNTVIAFSIKVAHEHLEDYGKCTKKATMDLIEAKLHQILDDSDDAIDEPSEWEEFVKGNFKYDPQIQEKDFKQCFTEAVGKLNTALGLRKTAVEALA